MDTFIWKFLAGLLFLGTLFEVAEYFYSYGEAVYYNVMAILFLGVVVSVGLIRIKNRMSEW